MSLCLTNSLINHIHALGSRVCIHYYRRAHSENVPRRYPGQSSSKSLLIDHFTRFIKRFFGIPVFDQLNTHEASLAPDITDDWMIFFHLFQTKDKEILQFLRVLKKAFLFYCFY